MTGRGSNLRCKLLLSVLSVTAFVPTRALGDDVQAEDALVRSIEAYLAGRMSDAADACARARSLASSNGLAARATQHCGVVRHVQGRRSDALVLFMRAQLLDPSLPGPEGVSPEASATYDCAMAFLEMGLLPDAVEREYAAGFQREAGRCPVGGARQGELRGADQSGSADASTAINARGVTGSADQGSEGPGEPEILARPPEPPPSTWPLWLTGSITIVGAGTAAGFAAATLTSDKPADYAIGANIAWVSAGVAATAFAILLYPHLVSGEDDDEHPR